MIEATPEEIEFIKKTLKTHLPKATFMIFGSRIMGTAKPYSDLDIAIDNSRPIPLQTLSRLSEVFANSNITYKIDIIDLHRISDEFKLLILKKHETLQ